MSEPILATRDLVRDFGGFRAVDGVDLAVANGAIHAVIGPNGAGKSTLFKLITGVLRPTRGTIMLGGEPIEGKRPHAIARRGLVQVFQLSSICARMTVAESVAVGIIAQRHRTFDVVSRYHRKAERDAMVVLDQVGLAHHGATVAGTLSHGDQRSLEIAMALATQPKVLMLDEPTAGMSPAETQTIANLVVSEARARNLTVVLSEHDMDVVFAVSDRVTVLHQGRVIANGTPSEIRSHPEVMDVYLGLHASGPGSSDGPRRASGSADR